jgi:hypothetical protein
MPTTMARRCLILFCVAFPATLGVGLHTGTVATNGGVAFIHGPAGGSYALPLTCRKDINGCWASNWEPCALLAKIHRLPGHGQCSRRHAAVARASIVPDDGRRRREDRRRAWRGQTGADGKLSGEPGGGGSRIPRAFRSFSSTEVEEPVEITKTRGSLIMSEEHWEDDGSVVRAKASFRRDEREITGESFWIEYKMRVLCDTPHAAPFQPPMQVSGSVPSTRESSVWSCVSKIL